MDMSFNQKRKINNRIVVLRAERGLSQRELANQLGVSRQTIISLEKNRYNPSLKLAFDIALFFGVVRMIANRIIRSIHSTFRLWNIQISYLVFNLWFNDSSCKYFKRTKKEILISRERNVSIWISGLGLGFLELLSSLFSHSWVKNNERKKKFGKQ